MSTVSYYTAEGLKKLREELDYLKSVMRPKASADIAEARDKEIFLRMLNTMLRKKHKECWKCVLLNWKKYILMPD